MEASLWNRFKNNIHLRRTTVLVMIILALYYVRAMMNTILLSFIFTYLIVHLVRFVQGKFKHVSDKLIVALTYLLIVVLLYFGLRYYVPVLVKQVTKMTKSVINYYQTNDVGWLMTQLHKYVSEKTISSQVKSSLTALTAALKGFGSVTMSFVMALVLSFFYTIELKEMQTFSQSFLKSDLFGWLFEDIAYFGRKFTNTFGVVLEAQFLIAVCNTALTIVCLAIMKMPQIFALGLMVFICSLVPVAGVIISLIPLSLVAYTVGGIQDVIYILIMIAVLHTLETYILNPKFMSSKTELPIFYTFVVLLFGEHFFGTWGLIVSVPIFTFFLDILGVKNINSKQEKLQEARKRIEHKRLEKEHKILKNNNLVDRLGANASGSFLFASKKAKKKKLYMGQGCKKIKFFAI
ncbi:AI-2E family transporter [Lactobacillus delbrueckii subsp. delbrueckii]|nr:AI-2E family transporter [Lactobacillus delbrueckii subsp. delbrueckii]GEA75243.1 AI-2E family transporter [Lactobacillus delbrueckii subsp. delbrueckii]